MEGEKKYQTDAKNKEKKEQRTNLPIYFDTTALCTVHYPHKSISRLKSIPGTEKFFILHTQQMELFQRNELLLSSCTCLFRK
jgi:hypothetical protein